VSPDVRCVYRSDQSLTSCRFKGAHGKPSLRSGRPEDGDGSPTQDFVGSTLARKAELSDSDSESGITPEYDTTTTDGIAQLIAVGILEFGVILHSVFIGLTLAVNDEFVTLFIVIIFHRKPLVLVRPTGKATSDKGIVHRDVRGPRYRLPIVCFETAKELTMGSLHRVLLVLCNDVSPKAI
jgi:hypothetical protein